MNRLSGRIIGCALTVQCTLGVGFLEKVYENALAHELRKAGLAVSQQHGVAVRYDGVVVGEYAVDLLVEHAILVELKAVRALDEIHRAQCLNYLKATGLRLCLLINFGLARLDIKRIVLGLRSTDPICVLCVFCGSIFLPAHARALDWYRSVRTFQTLT